MRKSLSSFDKNELETLMSELGSKPHIFNSEAQFQFELAWKIKERFDCDVKLEELSRISNGKKEYTDIILETEDLRIAVELKYKTALYEDKPNRIFLKSHGAADLGAYDFLWDVHRIQSLVGLEQEGEMISTCQRGYALILTNDACYWYNSTIKETINRDFLIGGDNDGFGILSKKLHQWYTLDGNIGFSKALQNNPSRQNDIDLKKNYGYQWKRYCTIENSINHNEFKYMIVEIDNIKNTTVDTDAIDFLKDRIVFEISKHIEHKYGFRWFKCVDIVMLASWYQKTYTMEELAMLDIEELFKQVCNEIDNDEIM